MYCFSDWCKVATWLQTVLRYRDAETATDAGDSRPGRC